MAPTTEEAAATTPVYRILGPLQVGTVRAPGGQQARVLGVLLLERGSVVPTRQLGRWALGPARAGDAAQVHVLVARLRRLLRDGDLPGSITSAMGGYRFHGDDDLIDADRFDSLVDAARSRGDADPAGARRLIDAASSLWRGELLAGLRLGDHPAAARLIDRRPAALEIGFIADLAMGHTNTLPDMLDAHRRYPDRERLAVIAMTALFLAGRQTEALALYQRTRQRMITGTGLEPGVELRRAEAAVLRHDIRPILADCLGIGSARLPTPRAVQTVARPAGAELADRTPLPRFVTSFVGREAIVQEVMSRSGQPGLTTLVGPGGVGKTRLVCESLAQRPVEGAASVWFCELALLDDGTGEPGDGRSVADDDALARLVARAVGARLEPGRRPIDAVAERLAERRGALVLDSCETQLAAAAAVASRLLASCPSLTILATSRTPLGVAGEHVCPTPPLDLDEEAAELYCHRAIDAHHGFSLGPDDVDAIPRLCARLDGLPLAIELAAARSRTAGPRELLVHLADAPLQLLRSGAAPRAARHRSLEATIEWSYRLLDADQQRLLRRLGVFSGPVTIDDLASVCDDSGDRGTLLDRLSELVERSMVATERRDGVTHHRLLDTIRAFALDRAAAANELDEARQRHAEHYAGVLDSVRGELRGPAERVAVMRLDHIWPEVRAAVGWSVRSARADLAVRLVAGLGFEAVFRERGEIVRWADDVLAMPEALSQPGADELLGTAALADWGYGHFDRGLQRAERAVALHEQRGTVLAPDVAAALPLHLSLRGDLALTVALLNANAREAERDGVPFAQLHARICEAMSLGYAGAAPADSALRTAEALAVQLGCPLLQAIAAFTRAIVVLDRRPEEAVIHARRCLELAESVGATWFLSAGTNYLVAALARTSTPESAMGPLRAGLEHQLRGGTLQSVANTIRNTVVLLDRLGRAERAAPLIGWLDVNRPSIPGTPAMRDHPAALSRDLRQRLGATTFEAMRTEGTTLTVEEVIRTALTSLADLDLLAPPPDQSGDAGGARRPPDVLSGAVVR